MSSQVPSITVLRERATQLLGRGCVRGQLKAMMAGAFAAKNAGTPLDPESTSQELVTQCQGLINQADQDVLAILVRELLEFVENTGPDVRVPFFIAPLPTDGVEGVDYASQLTAEGALPLTFTKISGDLPTGYTIDASTGNITGICPNAREGGFDFTARVENAYGYSDAEFNIFVEGTVVQIGYEPATIQYFTQHIGSPNFQLNANPNNTVTQFGAVYISGTTPYTYADITTDPNEPLPTGVSLNATTGQVSGTITDVDQLFDVFRFGIYPESWVGIGSQNNYSLFPIAKVYWGEWIGALPGSFTETDITATLTNNGTPGPRVYPNDTNTIVGVLAFVGTTAPIWGGELNYPAYFAFPLTGVARSRVIAVPSKFFTGTASFYWSQVTIGNVSLANPLASAFTPAWPTPYQTGLLITENGVQVPYDIYVLTARTSAVNVQWAISF